MRLFKLISLLICLILISCKSDTSRTEEQNETIGAKTATIWKVGQNVNEFGEPADGRYLYTTLKGTFSNNITSNSSLSVSLKIEKDTTITIGLAEYGSLYVKDEWATYKVKDREGIVHTGNLRFDSEGAAVLTADSIKPAFLLRPGELVFYIERTQDGYENHKDNIPSTYRFRINDGSIFQEALEMLAR